MEKGKRWEGGGKGRIGDRRESNSEEGRGYDSRLARQASKPSQPASHRGTLGGFPLRHYLSSRSRPHCARRTHRLCPANLPPFACFHSYERHRKGALVVCMCGETRTKTRRRARLCVRVFFFFIRKRGDGRVGSKGGERRGERGRKREAAATGSNGLERGRGSSAPARESREFSLGLMENALYLRVRTAEMSHTAAINVDGSCSSLRRDPSAARFRSEGPRTGGRLVNMINVLICTVSRLQLSFPTSATRALIAETKLHTSLSLVSHYRGRSSL